MRPIAGSSPSTCGIPTLGLDRRSCPNRHSAIENASVAGGRMFVEYLVDVKSRLAMFDLSGQAGWQTCVAGRRFAVGFHAAGRTRGCCSTPSPRPSIRRPCSPTTSRRHQHAVRGRHAAGRCWPLRDHAAVRDIEGRNPGSVLPDGAEGAAAKTAPIRPCCMGTAASRSA